MEIQSNQSQMFYLSDLLTGLFAVLVSRGIRSLSTRRNRLDEAFEKLYEDIEREARDANLTVSFRLTRHPFHGNSQDLQQELTSAAKRDLISFQNPEYTEISLKMEPDEAPLYLRTVPGSAEMYERLTTKFLEHSRNS